MVELGAEISTFPCHSSREHGHFEAKLSQQPGEASVQLVTIAATKVPDNLIVECFLVEHDWPAKGNVEILEGNLKQVCTVQSAKNTSTRPKGTR